MKKIYNFINKYKKEILVILILIIIYIGIYYFYSKNNYEKFTENTQITFTNGWDINNPSKYETWTVPEGVTKATFTVIGGKGGHPIQKDYKGLDYLVNLSSHVDSWGANVTVTLSVTPGHIYKLFVGNNGYKRESSDLNGFNFNNTILSKGGNLDLSNVNLGSGNLKNFSGGDVIFFANEGTYTGPGGSASVLCGNNGEMVVISGGGGGNANYGKTLSGGGSGGDSVDGNGGSGKNREESSVNVYLSGGKGGIGSINLISTIPETNITYGGGTNNNIKSGGGGGGGYRGGGIGKFDSGYRTGGGAGGSYIQSGNGAESIIISKATNEEPKIIIKWSNLPIDCVGSFVNDGECSATCGGGKQKQIYDITTPADFGGETCPHQAGEETEIDCNIQPCSPVNCVGEYEKLGDCVANDPNLNCGPGTQQQEYKISQSAENGGSECPVVATTTRSINCNLKPCPIDCEGSFGEYETCSVGCGGGTQSRTYTITKGAQHEGLECPHQDGDTEERQCNPDPCPINCNGGFENLGECSRECGDGVLRQFYDITTEAQHGGGQCDHKQNDLKTIPCNTQPCPTYGENTLLQEALKESNNKIQNIRYNIIDRQEELDTLTNKFNRLNKNISKIKTSSNYVPDDKTLTFY
jgi:hypothetical protein